MMKKLLLVHGAWHGAQCWQNVIKHLNGNFDATAIELPKSEQTHFNDYIQSILSWIENCPSPLTLVGHSFAGFLISHVACLCPQKIKELIYLNAFIPLNGESLFSLSAQLTSSNLNPYLTINEQENNLELKPIKMIQKFMYSPIDANVLKLSQFRPEPLQPLNHPVEIHANFKEIPKRAIIGTQDLTLKQEDQIWMCQRQNIPFELIEAAHCPFHLQAASVAQRITKT